MPTVCPYLNFNGCCEEAFRYYEKHLGGKVEAIMPFEGTPAAEHVPPDWRKKVMHAAIRIGDSQLMATDVWPERFNKTVGTAISLQLADPKEAERMFKALADGGEIEMPFEETFWALRFGAVRDRFGIPWMVNVDKPTG